MTGARGSFDLILNTIPSYHDYNAYTTLLNGTGRQVLLGLHKGLAAAMIVNLVTCDRSKVIFSGIGGIRATQEVQYNTLTSTISDIYILFINMRAASCLIP